jgi:hypothetical protein
MERSRAPALASSMAREIDKIREWINFLKRGMDKLGYGFHVNETQSPKRA